jgi:hypothetical protein
MTASEKIIVSIEGRKIPFPKEFAASDDVLKRSFVALFSWASEARVDRSKEAEGTITLVKAAGTKGSRRARTPLEHLVRTKGGKNPTIALYEKLAGQPLGTLGPAQVLMLEAKVRKTVELGEEHLTMVREAARRLRQSLARPAPFLPFGF